MGLFIALCRQKAYILIALRRRRLKKSAYKRVGQLVLGQKRNSGPLALLDGIKASSFTNLVPNDVMLFHPKV